MTALIWLFPPMFDGYGVGVVRFVVHPRDLLVVEDREGPLARAPKFRASSRLLSGFLQARTPDSHPRVGSHPRANPRPASPALPGRKRTRSPRPWGPPLGRARISCPHVAPRLTSRSRVTGSSP